MICVVEDDLNIREIEIFAIKTCGFTTVEAGSAKEFWEICSNKVPDLVLLDIMLPDEDGLEIVKKLRKKKQEASELQTQIEEQRSSITADRASVDALYPVLAGKTVAEALSQLRSAETDYKIKADKLKTAKRNLEKFIAEAKISEDQFAAEESPLPMESALYGLQATSAAMQITSTKTAANTLKSFFFIIFLLGI